MSILGVVRTEPGLIYKFFLEIDYMFVAEFSEMGGISVTREVKEFQEGGVNDHVHMLPGRIKHGNITLKTGITYNPMLWTWLHKGEYDAKVQRINVSIVLGNTLGKRVRQWDVLGAYPVKYSTSGLNTSQSEIAIETLELAHNGVSLNPAVMIPM